jgi:hypothetical protein
VLGPRTIAAGCLGLGVWIFCFTHGAVRGHGGDVLVIPFLVSVLAGIPVGTPPKRLAVVGATGVGVECWQALGWVGPDAPAWVHATVGSRFDPVDLGMYAVGLGIAGSLEWAWSRT